LPDSERYYWAVAMRNEREIHLARPRTLMNLSGPAAADLLDRLQLAPSQLLVIVDDFNLPLGALRFRSEGSDGGHRGLRSLTASLGTEKFGRLRLGIGPPADNVERTEFVLNRFEPDQLPPVERMIDNAVEAAVFAIDHRFEEAMSKYNRTPAGPDQ
jgi:PTH1 family peptidyl-tRNA hydrolase